MKRGLFYAACSIALSLTFFMGLYSVSGRDPGYWLALLLMNLALWSSFPRWRWLAVRQLTLALTLVVLANPFVSLAVEGVGSGMGGRPRMASNLRLRMHMVEGALPGLSGTVRFSTDGHGYRTNGPIDYEHKPEGVLRVVTIGASTMEEGFIDDRQTWTSLVAERLAKAWGRKVELINTGFSGLRAVHNYDALREAEAYQPDLVLFLMGINDWNRAIVEGARADVVPRRTSLIASLAVFSVQHTVVYQAIQFAWRLSVSWADCWGVDPPMIEETGWQLKSQANSLDRPNTIAFHPDAVSDDYAYWVGQIMEECGATHLRCVFIDQPTAYHADITQDLRQRLWMTPADASYTVSFDDISHLASVYNEWLARTAADKGFRFCSIARHMPPTTDYFFDDCHYTSNGSRTVAKLVGDCLVDGD